MAANLEFDYEECLKKNPQFNKQDLMTLKEWVGQQDNIIPSDMSDKQLLLFYNACKMVIEDTKKCIKAYYTIRDNAPDMFDNRNCDEPRMKTEQEALEYFILPGVTDEGYDVVFHRLYQYEPEKYFLSDSCKMLFMTIDACLYKNGPRPGFVFLFDMKGVKLGHIARCPIGGLAKFCQYIQEALPVNMKAIHILNCSSYIDKILFLLKPFLKKELVQMINLHPPNTDMEKFFNDCVPKRLVPKNHGGDAPDSQLLHLKNCEILKSLKPYFDAEERHRNSYSKKSKKKSSVERGFEDLCID